MMKPIDAATKPTFGTKAIRAASVPREKESLHVKGADEYRYAACQPTMAELNILITGRKKEQRNATIAPYTAIRGQRSRDINDSAMCHP
jgi:hypothetical protein